MKNVVNISETYLNEILGSSRREKVKDYIFDGIFENLNENSRTVKRKCRENLKEISLEFDKNLWKIAEKSLDLRKYNGNLREV